MPRPKTNKQRPLTLVVSADATGFPFISNVDFCSAEMSVQWGRTFFGDISLSEAQEPTVKVYFSNVIGDLVEVHFSPFTGGDIQISVDEKSYDDVVAALLAMASPADEEVQEGPVSEGVDDGYEDSEDSEDDDREEEADEGFEDEEEFEDEDELEDEEDLSEDEFEEEYEEEDEDD